MKAIKPFKGVKNGDIYPTEFQPGDEIPTELEAGARAERAVQMSAPSARRRAELPPNPGQDAAPSESSDDTGGKAVDKVDGESTAAADGDKQQDLANPAGE